MSKQLALKKVDLLSQDEMTVYPLDICTSHEMEMFAGKLCTVLSVLPKYSQEGIKQAMFHQT